MFPTVIILFSVLAAACASAGALFVSVRKAPEGYEDHTGFNYLLWRNEFPQTPNVACVWIGDFTWEWATSADQASA